MNVSFMETKNEIKKIPWIIGFDYLRVFFIICVIYMHLHKSPPNENNGLLHYFFYYGLCCSATPGFLLISLYIQGIKNNTNQSPYFGLANYTYLYLFWVGCWCLLTKSYPEPSIRGVFLHLLQGGGWSFYFFAALIYTHLVRIYIAPWNDKSLWCGLLLSMIVTFAIFCGLFMDNRLSQTTETYWWPVNFMPAPFISCLLERNRVVIQSKPKIATKICIVILLTAIFVMLLEMKLVQNISGNYTYLAMPEYLRASPWLFATCVMIYAHSFNYSNKIVGFFARNTLGIFCLHVFVLDGIASIMNKLISIEEYATLATLCMTFVGCALAAELIRKVLRSRLI